MANKSTKRKNVLRRELLPFMNQETGKVAANSLSLGVWLGNLR